MVTPSRGQNARQLVCWGRMSMRLTQDFDSSSSTADERGRSEASGLRVFALDNVQLELSFPPSSYRVCTLYVSDTQWHKISDLGQQLIPCRGVAVVRRRICYSALAWGLLHASRSTQTVLQNDVRIYCMHAPACTP